MTTPPTITERPPEFDARLVAYLPGLRKVANHIDKDSADDLVHDTVAWACDRWMNFSGDPASPKSGFWNWLQINMRAIAQNRRNLKSERVTHTGIDAIRFAATQPSQEDETDLRHVMADLSTRRGGQMLLRVAEGERLWEIGVDYGVSRERVRQLVTQERAALREAW